MCPRNHSSLVPFSVLQHLYMAVLGDAALAFINAFHLYKGDYTRMKDLFIGTPSKVDLFLKIDVAIALLYGVSDLLFPQDILSMVQVREGWSSFFSLIQR